MAHTPQSISAVVLLETYTHASIQQIARRRGVEIKGKGKSALVKELASTLYDAGHISAALENLEPIEREVLDRLVALGGEVPTSALRGRLEAEGKVDKPNGRSWATYSSPTGSARRSGSRKFEDIVARLGALGLVFTCNTGISRSLDLGVPGPYLFIPNGILKRLPSTSLEVECATKPPGEILSHPDALLRDVYLLLSHVRAEPIQLTTKGHIPKRKLVQIDETLRQPEDAAEARSEAELGRLPLLRALAEQLGLLLAGPDGLTLGDAVGAFFAHPRGTRLRQLYDAYRETPNWSELARLPDLTISPRAGIYDPRIAQARQRVLTEMGEMPGGQWIPISHLIDRLRQRDFEFLLPRDWRYSSYYYGSSYQEPNPYYGGNPLGLSFYSRDGQQGDWETVEAAFIRVIVEEALFWLGMVDLGVADDGSLSSFRVTEIGARLLAGRMPSMSVAPPNVVIQPNFQIFAFEPTDEDVLFTLDRLAERVRSEQVVEYRLTRDSAYAAQRTGMETEAILTFLDRVSSTPIPQNVRRSIEEWGAQHDRILVRRGAAVVHAIDEKSLDALYADPELGRLLGRRIAATAALVPADHLTSISDYLLRREADGHPLPALSEGNDGYEPAAITADPSGRLTFRQKLPSMYVVRALRPFTTEQSDGTLCLTPESLRRASHGARRRTRSNGSAASLTAEDMIATLERFHDGPLPTEVAAMVRRWAKDWGQGALLETVLLQVEDAEIMADLLADQDIQPYLSPIPGAPTLATVSGVHADRVRELLQERGMDLRNRLPAH